jgi:hypothetical protein
MAVVNNVVCLPLMQVLARTRDMSQSRRRERASASDGGGGDPQPPAAQAQRSIEPSLATARIAAPAAVPLLEGAQREEDGVVPSVVQPGRETKGQKKKRRQKERKERQKGRYPTVLRTGQDDVGPLIGRLLTPKALMSTGGGTP